MMRIVCIVLLVFALLCVVVYLVDYRQRKSFNKRIGLKIESQSGVTTDVEINYKAPVISTSQILICAPITKVWSVLTSINEWPLWQSEVTKAHLDGLPQQGATFTWQSGGISFSSRIHSSNPTIFFGWTGTTLGAQAIHNWTFKEVGEKTYIMVEESLEGLLPYLLKNRFRNNLGIGMKKNLTELKIACESLESSMH